jgi:penicillin V acylase-like amidase (Ntn superfamily)
MLKSNRLLSVTFLVLASGPFLFSHPAAYACTGIMLRTEDGSVVHGRTVEFGITIDTTIGVIPRGYTFVGQTPNGNVFRDKRTLLGPSSWMATDRSNWSVR